MREQNKNTSLNQDSAGSVNVNHVISNNFELGGLSMPESLEEYEYRKNVEAITTASKAEIIAENKIREAKDRRKMLKNLVVEKQQNVGKNSPIQLSVQQKIDSEYVTQNIQEIERLQSQNNIVISQDIDVIKLQVEVNDAIDNMAKLSDIDSAEDLEVSFTNSGGTPQLKFSVKRQQIPSDFLLISKMVRKFNDAIKHRVLDVRTISAVNGNYGIKDKKERLSACSLSYRPDGTTLNKGTRVIISKSEDYDSSKNIVFFIQESRSKWIGTIDSKKFATREDYLIFIANAICDFYSLGFDITQERLMIEKKSLSGLSRVAEVIMKNGGFKCKLKKDEDLVSMIEIITSGSKNQWLHVYIYPGKYKDTYEINLYSKADTSWQSNTNLGDTLTINWLLDNINEHLKNWFAKNWDADINLQLNKDKYMADKFDRVKMRLAFQKIIEIRNSNDYIGIELTKALSTIETREIMPGDYGAETIIGKTNYVDYFVLTHLGYLIAGSHSKGVSIKTGLPVNNRKYLFQIEYSINGKKCIYRSIEFEDVLKDTGFLTDKPIDGTSISKY